MNVEPLHAPDSSLPLPLRELRFPRDVAAGNLSIWLPGLGWKAAGVARGTVQVPGEARVRLDAEGDGDALLRTLARLPAEGLHFLDLRDRPLTRDHLAALAPLQDLETLCLAQTGVNDAVLDALPTLPRLHTLDLTLSAAGNEGASFLGRQPALRSLLMNQTCLGDEAFAAVLALRDLEVLRLGATQLSSAALEQLPQLPALRDLELPTAANDAVLAGLARLPRLEALWLVRGQFSENATRFLAPLSTLRVLALPDYVGDYGLSFLAGHRALESLWLECTWISHRGLSALREVPSLRYLFLHSVVGPEEAGVLAGLPRLEGLAVHDAGMEGDALLRLGASASLRELKVHVPNLADRCGWDLAPLRGLRRLHLYESRLSDEGFEALRPQLPGTLLTRGLPRLRLLPTAVRARVVRRDRARAATDPWVEVPPTPGGVPLAPGTELGFRAADERLTDLLYLAADAPGRLVEIKTQRCDFEDAVVRLLPAFTGLKTLEAPGATLAEGFAAALPRLSELLKLTLDDTAPTGAWTRALARCQRLQVLELRRVSLDAAGLAELQAGLPALRRLALEGVALPEAAVAAFRTARPQVDLSWCLPTPDAHSGDRERLLPGVIPC